MTASEIVCSYYSIVWEARRPDQIPSYFSEAYINHAGSRGTLSGPAGIRANYDSLVVAFPDVTFTLDDVIADGEKIVARYTMRGTHDGLFQGIAPTRRAVIVPGIGIYRVADGLIQESWVLRDSLSLLKQLGAA